MQGSPAVAGAVPPFSAGRRDGSTGFEASSPIAGRWPLEFLAYHRQRRGSPVFHLVMLDTSASMLRNNRLADAKAAILEIADRAYLARGQLAILAFGNQAVRTVLPRRRAPRALRDLLDTVDGGGGTPLRQVVVQAARYQRQLQSRQPELVLRNYLITDGRSRASLDGIELAGDTVLVDIEKSPVRRGRGREIAAMLDAGYVPLPV